MLGQRKGICWFAIIVWRNKSAQIHAKINTSSKHKKPTWRDALETIQVQLTLKTGIGCLQKVATEYRSIQHNRFSKRNEKNQWGQSSAVYPCPLQQRAKRMITYIYNKLHDGWLTLAIPFLQRDLDCAPRKIYRTEYIPCEIQKKIQERQDRDSWPKIIEQVIKNNKIIARLPPMGLPRDNVRVAAIFNVLQHKVELHSKALLLATLSQGVVLTEGSIRGMKEATYVRYAHIGIVAVWMLHTRPLGLVVLSIAVVVAHDRLLVGSLILELYIDVSTV